MILLLHAILSHPNSIIGKFVDVFLPVTRHLPLIRTLGACECRDDAVLRQEHAYSPTPNDPNCD